MSIHKQRIWTSPKQAQLPRKAPVPQVDKEHFADLRKLERNPNHLNDRLKDVK